MEKCLWQHQIGIKRSNTRRPGIACPTKPVYNTTRISRFHTDCRHFFIVSLLCYFSNCLKKLWLHYGCHLCCIFRFPCKFTMSELLLDTVIIFFISTDFGIMRSFRLFSTFWKIFLYFFELMKWYEFIIWKLCSLV
jgi:hypothetical protein